MVILKKVVICVSALVFLLAISYSIKALDYSTNLSIEKATVEQGGEVSIPIKISNLPKEGVNSFNFGIKYDANKLKLNSIKTSKAIKSEGDFLYNEVTEGIVFCLFNDLTQGENQITEEGDLIYLNFLVKEESVSGDTNIELYEDDKRKITMATLDSGKINLATTNGGINIISLQDIDGNGIVDMLDIAEVGNLYNVKSTDSNYKKRVDLNNDNIIDIYDIVKVASKVGDVSGK